MPLGPLGVLLGPFGLLWVLLGCSWVLLKFSWGALGVPMGALGARLGPLGALLGRTWVLLGCSWGLLGRSWGALGVPLGAFLVLTREKVRLLNTFSCPSAHQRRQETPARAQTSTNTTKTRTARAQTSANTTKTRTQEHVEGANFYQRFLTDRNGPRTYPLPEPLPLCFRFRLVAMGTTLSALRKLDLAVNGKRRPS